MGFEVREFTNDLVTITVQLRRCYRGLNCGPGAALLSCFKNSGQEVPFACFEAEADLADVPEKTDAV